MNRGMAQTTRGLYSLLSSPRIYTLVESVGGFLEGRGRVIRDHIRPAQGERILDLGCGPGDVCGLLPVGTHYVGFDESEAYIRSAKARFGDRGDFHCSRIELASIQEAAFDIVLAFGVLHHLDDAEAGHLFKAAHRALRPGGRLFTLDGCYLRGQSPAARLLLALDRGRSIRTVEAYLALNDGIFATISASIFHDLFKVPYTTVVIECRK